MIRRKSWSSCCMTAWKKKTKKLLSYMGHANGSILRLSSLKVTKHYDIVCMHECECLYKYINFFEKRTQKMVYHLVPCFVLTKLFCFFFFFCFNFPFCFAWLCRCVFTKFRSFVASWHGLFSHFLLLYML